MKKGTKHYRIVTDKGDSLLIRQELFQNLLQTLEQLAGSTQNRQHAHHPKK